MRSEDFKKKSREVKKLQNVTIIIDVTRIMTKKSYDKPQVK